MPPDDNRVVLFTAWRHCRACGSTFRPRRPTHLLCRACCRADAEFEALERERWYKPEGASKPLVVIRRAIDVARALPSASWRLRPFIEKNAIIFLYGDYETFKSFVIVDWALRMSLGMPALGYAWATEPSPVVLISAEGRGLGTRLRGWCIRHRPSEDWEAVLAAARLYCIEHPVNLSDLTNAAALAAEIEKLAITPGAVLIDTMSRNSNGQIEASTADASTYLAIIDQQIRARYQASVVLTHHVGHAEKGRMRGPIVLAANTDTMIRIERPDREQRVATLEVERMKDAERPAPQALRADVVELGEDDADGRPITTLALTVTDAPLAPARGAAAEPRGKAQRQLLQALRAQEGQQVWTIADLREVGRRAGLHRNTAISAAEALTFSPHLKATIGGWTLADAPQS